MRIVTGLLAGTAALILGHGSLAAETAPATAGAETLTCGAPLAWDETEESLKKKFGAENVVYQDLGGAEGMEMMGTLLFPNDPSRALRIVWNDDAKRADPAMIQADVGWDAEYTKWTPGSWVTKEGIRPGTPIEEVEKINGKPFRLSGFGWDYGGSPVSFEGGALEQLDDTTCWLGLTFMSTAENVPDTVLGDQEIVSNAKDVLAAKPVVARVTISYVRPEAATP